MVGLLLDTHALYWLVSGEEELSEEALVAIGERQEIRALFVSPISAWEISIAVGKNRVADRPRLGDDPPDRWFRKAMGVAAARIAPIGQAVAVEAAEVAAYTGHRDPGDCFLIATARVKRLSIVTRDRTIQSISAGEPGYLDVVAC